MPLIIFSAILRISFSTWFFIHLINSFNKLSSYSKPGTELSPGEKVVNKTDRLPPLGP